MTWREAQALHGKAYWLDLMTRLEANVSAMARDAGVQRTHVYGHLRKFGVELPTVRVNPFAHRGNWDDLN